MIISEGIPMTNGEVFALLRRRRDERNAKTQPPFGMQFVGSSSTAQVQQQRGPASSTVNASTHTSIFFPPEPLFADADLCNANGAMSAASRLYAKSNTLFSSSAGSHLLVLLMEVRALRYLSQYSTITGKHSIHAIYGPSSLYTRRRRNSHAAGSLEEEEAEEGSAHQTHNSAISLTPADNGIGETIRTTKTEEQNLLQKVQRSRPGTVGHVRAVNALLEFWETSGAEVERRCSAGVKAVLRAVKQRLNDSNCGRDDNSAAYGNNNNDSNGNSPSTNNNTDKERQSPPSEHPRLLFAPPSVPLELFVAEQSPFAAAAVNRESGAVATTTGSAITSKESHQWTEQDVLRLVVGRPQSCLDLHRIMDDVGELVGQNEELLSFIEEELVKVFV